MYNTLHLSCFVLLCLVVAVSDWTLRKVFNVVILVGLAAQGMFLMFMNGEAPGMINAIEPAVTGLAIGFVFFLPLYVFGAMGAGDVKFFALVGWWLGPAGLLSVFVIASLMAGVHVLALNAAGSILALAVRDMGERIGSLIPAIALWRGTGGKGRRRQRRGIPYAAYMAVGAVGMLVWRS